MNTKQRERKERADKRSQYVAEASSVVVTRRRMSRKDVLNFHLVHPGGATTICGIPSLDWATFRSDVKAKDRKVCRLCCRESLALYGKSVSVEQVVTDFNEAIQNVA